MVSNDVCCVQVSENLTRIEARLEALEELRWYENHMKIKSERLVEDTCYNINDPGVYLIPVRWSYYVKAYCDKDTHGWMVILRRTDSIVDFSRGWQDYKFGFGDLNTDYWLGLEHMHYLTSDQSYALRVDIEFFNGTSQYADYANFRVSSEGDKYSLLLSSIMPTSTTYENRLASHSGQKFTTFDSDNDSHNSTNCAAFYNGGWWYHSCYSSKFTGFYHHQDVDDGKGIVWKHENGRFITLKSAVMKIRKKP